MEKEEKGGTDGKRKQADGRHLRPMNIPFQLAKHSLRRGSGLAATCADCAGAGGPEMAEDGSTRRSAGCHFSPPTRSEKQYTRELLRTAEEIRVHVEGPTGEAVARGGYEGWSGWPRLRPGPMPFELTTSCSSISQPSIPRWSDYPSQLCQGAQIRRKAQRAK